MRKEFILLSAASILAGLLAEYEPKFEPPTYYGPEIKDYSTPIIATPSIATPSIIIATEGEIR